MAVTISSEFIPNFSEMKQDTKSQKTKSNPVPLPKIKQITEKKEKKDDTDSTESFGRSEPSEPSERSKLLMQITLYCNSKYFKDMLKAHNFKINQMSKLNTEALKSKLDQIEKIIGYNVNEKSFNSLCKGASKATETGISLLGYNINGTTEEVFEDDAFNIALEQIRIKRLAGMVIKPEFILLQCWGKTAMKKYGQNYMSSLMNAKKFNKKPITKKVACPIPEPPISKKTNFKPDKKLDTKVKIVDGIPQIV